jgi:hypothetical protein
VFINELVKNGVFRKWYDLKFIPPKNINLVRIIPAKILIDLKIKKR